MARIPAGTPTRVRILDTTRFPIPSYVRTTQFFAVLDPIHRTLFDKLSVSSGKRDEAVCLFQAIAFGHTRCNDLADFLRRPTNQSSQLWELRGLCRCLFAFSIGSCELGL